MEEIFFKILKAVSVNILSTHSPYVENLQGNPLKSLRRQGTHSPNSFIMLSWMHCSERYRNWRTLKIIHLWKDKSKLTPFSDDMILYLRHTQSAPKHMKYSQNFSSLTRKVSVSKIKSFSIYYQQSQLRKLLWAESHLK